MYNKFTVSDGNSLHIKLCSRVLDNVVSNSRDIMAGIRLSSDIERSALELRVFHHELKQELVEVLSHHLLVSSEMGRVFGLGVSGSDWLVNEEKIGVLVPGKVISFQGKVVVDSIRAVFVENSQFRGAAGSSSEPDH